MIGRALITGATGFVGGKLSRRLAGEGWEIVRWGYPPEPGAAVCDIADPGQVRDLLAQAGPVTHVFHLAALTFVPDALRDPASAMRINYQGTVNLAESMREYVPDARLVYVGSAEVYGAPRFLPVTEEHPLCPGNPYAISKAAADHYCAYCAQSGVLDVIRMRPFNHSGPGQSSQFVLSSFARQIAEIEAGVRSPELRVGNLEAARDFLHVDDVVSAYALAALEGRSGHAYNICSGTARRIQDALDALCGMSRAPLSVVRDMERFRPVDVPEVCGDHALLTEHTGWAPRISFPDLLADLLEGWRGAVRG